MTSKRLYIFLLFLFANLAFSQESTNSKIIQKDIKTKSGNDIYDVLPATKLIQKKTDNNYNSHFPNRISSSSKIFVYYNGKFFSQDTLDKIKNKNDFSFEIIKIPDSISKKTSRELYT